MADHSSCMRLAPHLHISAAPLFGSMPVLPGGRDMIEEYLCALHKVLRYALNEYGKVFAFRFDLRLPEVESESWAAGGNVVVSRFIESLKSKIRHNRDVARKIYHRSHDTRLRYFWVREVGVTGRVHYHFVALVNRNAFNWLGDFQVPGRSNMANRVFDAWASALGLPMEDVRELVHFPKFPAYSLDARDQSSVNEFFQRASYLCKADTKSYGNGCHGYGASRG